MLATPAGPVARLTRSPANDHPVRRVEGAQGPPDVRHRPGTHPARAIAFRPDRRGPGLGRLRTEQGLHRLLRCRTRAGHDDRSARQAGTHTLIDAVPRGGFSPLGAVFRETRSDGIVPQAWPNLVLPLDR